MPTEEERRRKIIIDSQVVSMAMKGIRGCMDGTLTESQISRMIALDEEYLSRCEQIERNP
jgi:hypothetical protein